MPKCNGYRIIDFSKYISQEHNKKNLYPLAIYRPVSSRLLLYMTIQLNIKYKSRLENY